MKYSLTACLALFFSLSFAQLSVRNDAFVYVNDQVLFVQDDVNLEEATTNLYLRNEAQLIQGTGTTGNSGVGELSVYQNSEVNQYSYHYWCSPVGGILANNANNNDFRINQLDDPLLGTGDPIDSNDSFFTTNYNGTTSPALTISTRWLWTYVTATEYVDWDFAGDVGDVLPGLGFTMKGMSDTSVATGITPMDQTYDFRGKPNNGTITNAISPNEFTLIGNPYPSAIDAARFLWDNDGSLEDQTSPSVGPITGAIYYWEQDPANADSHYLNKYVGGYASYTCTEPGVGSFMFSSVAAPYLWYNGSGDVIGPVGVPQSSLRFANRYIPIGQGFMVEGASGSTSVELNNSHRIYIKESNANSTFFRNNNATTASTLNETSIQYDINGNYIIPEDYKRFRIVVGFNELYSRELLANFHNTATGGFDYGLEAKRPNEVESDAYWTQDDEAYVIQANNFEFDLKIPLVIDLEEHQPLSFDIYDVQNFEYDQEIYLHDIENNIYVDLRAQNYIINVEPGNYTDRFEIVFRNQSLDVNEFNADSLTINQNNGNHQLTVLNPKSLDVSSIEVYDVAGKRLLHGTYDSVLNRYELSTLNLSDGVYVVNVKSYANAVKSQKIIIKN